MPIFTTETLGKRQIPCQYSQTTQITLAVITRGFSKQLTHARFSLPIYSLAGAVAYIGFTLKAVCPQQLLAAARPLVSKAYEILIKIKRNLKVVSQKVKKVEITN